ncbi:MULTISPECIES: glutamine--fructose-6-phosphate transaminase (isomerizing) [Pseudothermotoga]|uniref:Glutamine--fructose-6-phosphate aminotransferase [isomerizing] n=1 Tax=Pseudothermotoga lettingae (strain ATCC BAA-301 / DSM 14385 / NBRC 107922 / TMO) TaxID=416591 RepID=A8F8G3_PSELT|nr:MULTISPECIES: glutamine--fructose-6-phosphate transaminase (isomerizing) [Pseudothermotoga]ABV34447.1 glucosamine--fructose-6-phosphate aminotransferase, isomerizing [Pseudothermotoga lettingae TMO]KUK20403.1 MAG: Glutamine--fructose-6-phosphate aminotransferase [Pseudothermotoga lettingae]GLI48606.1 glutamine--fructose-6-phosphate aminotransferase [isomerizing] [Pseudothermotoga lettingae TMO]HBT25562.1 glutamine--fructose-6-phosphate transaminase (isomerizing) [Pseudothermotoga sp.]
MCGIVGLIGENIKVIDLIEALEKLEYRGYDSAGIAFLKDGVIQLAKAKGKVKVLKDHLQSVLKEHTENGIAHTRWATHGEPNDINAHPHIDCTGKISVVHNGIIENFRSLKVRLQELGHNFVSETDTEIIPHLIEEYYNGDLLEAVRKTVLKLEGSYAIAVIHSDHPDVIIGARKGSPLVVGKGDSVVGLASDVTPLLKFMKDVIFLEDGEIALLRKNELRIFGTDGIEHNCKPVEITWSYEDAQKSGYKHFMLKEIFEEPSCIVSVLTGRIKDGRVVLQELEPFEVSLKELQTLKVVACGTSSHAALVFKYFLENMSDVTVDVDVSSEFRYKKPHIKPGSIMVAISQSGETADTLESVRLAKKYGAKIISVTNVLGSTLTRESDIVLYLNAGPEISVAATKSYVAQLVMLYLLAIKIIQSKESTGKRDFVDKLLRLPEVFENSLKGAESIHAIAKKYKDFKHFMYIGRGYGYPTALEGALKLKEISYIHATAYPAGELKHGPIAMLGPDFPVFSIIPYDSLFQKMKSNVIECKSRNAKILAVTNDENYELKELADDLIYVNTSDEQLYPVLMTPAIQLFAYFVADELGLDPDKPRNLAKSVTVE